MIIVVLQVKLAFNPICIKVFSALKRSRGGSVNPPTQITGFCPRGSNFRLKCSYRQFPIDWYHFLYFPTIFRWYISTPKKKRQKCQ